MYFALSLARMVSGTPARISHEHKTVYEQQMDPWGYRSAWGERHIAAIESLVRKAGRGRPVERAVDLGCGEGWITGRVAPLCGTLVAVDASELALSRAQERCADNSNVSFTRWDVTSERAFGRFDLVLAVCFLEVLLRPKPRRRARRLILEMLEPGGHLLVTTTKRPPVVEGSAWAGLLVQGAAGIDRFVKRSGVFAEVAREETETHVMTLYQHRRATPPAIT